MAMNKNKLVLILCFLGMMSSFNAQTEHWVKLSNKNGTPYTISNPSAFLTPAAVQRRTTYNVPIHFTDLPVTPLYITQVEAIANVTVLYASKWLNGLVVSISSGSTTALAAINSLTYVTGTRLVNRYKLDMPVVEEPAFVGDEFTKRWGQNWGVPLYSWETHRAQGFKWWLQRVRKVGVMFHLFRIDHVLGFYRIYGFPWRPQSAPLQWRQSPRASSARGTRHSPHGSSWLRPNG